jgi:micrococcal nuclease
VGALLVVAIGLASVGTLDRAQGDPPPPATATSGPATTTTEAPAASTSSAPPTDQGLVVTSVVDGDTVRLSDGRTVRLAQVDAPETSACYGSESTATLRRLVEGKTVTLRRPDDAPKRDRYGRTLGELLLDGISADEELIRVGAAEWYEQFAHEDEELAHRLSAAEQEAVAEGRGLWTACRSSVRPHVTAPTTSTTSVPTPPAVQSFVGTAAGAGSCHPGYPDDCIPPGPPDLDCGSPSVRRRVHVDHAHGDPHAFDRDRDGWGCESYGAP